jgi:hypothetical protein
MSTQPKPLNYAFPNFIPGRHRIPPNFKLFPEAFFPELKAASLPSTPPIPPTVATGDIITAGHENTVTTAINDLWTNEQWIAANMLADPTTATGDIMVRGSSGLTRLPVGGNGQVLTADSTVTALGLKWTALSAASIGAVPTTRQVIAGAGMTGGGSLATDVTLNAKPMAASGAAHSPGMVPDPGATAGATRFLREDATWTVVSASAIGAVATSFQVIAGPGLTGGGALTGSSVMLSAPVMIASGASHAAGLAPDPGATAGITRYLREDATWVALSAASVGAVPTTTQVIAGPGLSGGGALSGNVTLSAPVMIASGSGHAAGLVPDPGATAGAAHYLREDGTWAVPPGAGGGMNDPTTTLGDLIVHGSGGTTRLPVGGNGQVLTADSTVAALGVKWAAPTVGMTDPTTTKGDLIVHGTVTTRIGVGGDGQVLTADSTQTLGVKWATPTGTANYWVNGALIGTQPTLNLIAGSNITISGVVTGSRVDVTINSTAAGGANQTPWTSDIDAASHMLSNASAIGVGTGANTAWPLWLVINSASSTGQAQMWNKASGGASGFLLAAEGGTNAGGIMFCGSAYAAPTWSSTLFVYTQGANDIGFGTANVERMRITKTGLVGIGTAVPAQRVTIVGDAQNWATLTQTTISISDTDATASGANGGRLLRIMNRRNTGVISQNLTSADGTNFTLDQTGNGGLWASFNNASFSISFASAGTNPVAISPAILTAVATGVGIGVSVPLNTFHVHAAANENLLVGQAVSISGAVSVSAVNDANSANTPLEIRANPTVFMVGNVGIGMNPSYALDVNGGARCSGAFFCNSSITASQNVYASGSVLASGVGSTFGGPAGSASAPSTANTNILLYNNSTVNWAGIGADGGGNMYFKVGTSGSPAAAVTILASNQFVGIGTGATTPANQLTIIPVSNFGSATITSQLAIGEQSNNAAYRLNLGYFNDGNWKGFVQTYMNSGGAALLLNPNGGNVGVNSTSPAYPLTVHGQVAFYHGTQSCAFFQTSAGAAGWQIGRSINGNDQNDFFIYNQANSTVAVSIVNTNVAINTTNTTARFTISTSGYSSPAAGQNRASVYFTPGTWGLQIGHYAAGDTWFQSQRDDGNGSMYNILLQPIGGGVGIGMQSGPAYNLQLANDSAGKPSANWTVTSDVRTKRNIRPYLEGLKTLLRLHPTSFEYNGEAETPEGLERVGLVAQDVADVIPGCVQKIVAHIHGEETEVLALNTSDLQWMMLNALREIDTRLREANL